MKSNTGRNASGAVPVSGDFLSYPNCEKDERKSIMKAIFRICIILSFVWLVVGCSITTTYGVKPKEDVFEEDKYAFTIFYNAWSSSYDVDVRAKQEIKQFMEGEGYKYFDISNIRRSPSSGRDIYEVKFSRYFSLNGASNRSSNLSYAHSRRDEDGFEVTHFQYSDKNNRGVISIRTYGQGIEAREWLVKNIGAICSSKNITLKAGEESAKGGRYRILDEKIENNILTVHFEASF